MRARDSDCPLVIPPLATASLTTPSLCSPIDPSVTITALVAQLVSFPIGKFLERTLPTRQFTTFGYTWSFNPGPWNIKEHCLVTVMANVVSGGAYATEIIVSLSNRSRQFIRISFFPSVRRI